MKPGLMKGPNHPMPVIDDLPRRIVPKKWKNVPLPIVDAFLEVIRVFTELK